MLAWMVMADCVAVVVLSIIVGRGARPRESGK